MPDPYFISACVVLYEGGVPLVPRAKILAALIRASQGAVTVKCFTPPGSPTSWALMGAGESERRPISRTLAVQIMARL